MLPIAKGEGLLPWVHWCSRSFTLPRYLSESVARYESHRIWLTSLVSYHRVKLPVTAGCWFGDDVWLLCHDTAKVVLITCLVPIGSGSFRKYAVSLPSMLAAHSRATLHW